MSSLVFCKVRPTISKFFNPPSLVTTGAKPRSSLAYLVTTENSSVRASLPALKYLAISSMGSRSPMCLGISSAATATGLKDGGGARRPLKPLSLSAALSSSSFSLSFSASMGNFIKKSLLRSSSSGNVSIWTTAASWSAFIEASRSVFGPIICTLSIFFIT